MSVNNYKPHLLILPEDDANADLAKGFQLAEPVAFRQMFVLPVAGGWRNVLEEFKSNHIRLLEKWPRRLFVLLFDFDGRMERLEQAKSEIPRHLADRVFVLGVATEPEDLKELGLPARVGKRLAEDCVTESNQVWGHALIRHNLPEAARLRAQVREFLFAN